MRAEDIVGRKQLNQVLRGRKCAVHKNKQKNASRAKQKQSFNRFGE